MKALFVTEGSANVESGLLDDEAFNPESLALSTKL